MGRACETACVVILELYISFQLVDTFYFNLANADQNDQSSQDFFGPFIDLERPDRIDKENERQDEMNNSLENDASNILPSVVNTSGKSLYRNGTEGPSRKEARLPDGDASLPEPLSVEKPGYTPGLESEQPDIAGFRGSGLGCNNVREEKYRCCRVFDQVIEAWWCPERHPFCCHQGTYCAVCCTLDELRRTENSLPSPASCYQTRQRAPELHQPPPEEEPPVDDSWFWSGMKAAWLTMFAVLIASLCCTCLAYKCIRYLATIVNEEDTDLEEEYLAYHFDTLGLVSAEDRPPGRQTTTRGLLPPKYSDINFIPVEPEPPVSSAAPGEPPPQYTSEPEPEPEPGTEPEPETQSGTEPEPETARPASAPPPADRI